MQKWREKADFIMLYFGIEGLDQNENHEKTPHVLRKILVQ